MKNRLKTFMGCVFCFGTQFPSHMRTYPRVFWGVVLGSFMLGWWRKVKEFPARPPRDKLLIDKAFVPDNAIVMNVRDWTRMPGGRKKADSKFSGEEFGETLVKNFKLAEQWDVMLVVDITGTLGYAYSWVEEAFGSMTVCHSPESIMRRMRVVARGCEFYVDDIIVALERAEVRYWGNSAI